MQWTSRTKFALAAAALFLAQTSWHPGPRSSLALAGEQVPHAPTPGPQSQNSTTVPSLSEREKSAAQEFFVMIDPSHGGEDRGTILPGRIEEKDVTLNLARDLRRQLEERGVHAKLLRETDINLSLDRRAETTNQEHAGLYIAFHAGLPGKGVRVYLAAGPSSTAPVQGFLLWDSAQSSTMERSRMVARAVSAELRRTDLTVNQLTAPLRPLNNLMVPAISVEWAPGPAELKPQESSRIAGRITSAVASAIAQIQGSLGAHP